MNAKLALCDIHKTENTMAAILKRIGWVVLCAVVVVLPAAFYVVDSTQAPWWYVALATLFSALGMGVFAISAGLLTLVARRGCPQGGIKPALVTTTLVGAFTCFAVISAASRL